ncbi:Fe2+ transport system protein FeoA [Maridesulfovibrio ferrireducens]|uniref:Fe2+ transport system protein FeoA n=1 Tax=Maridesulfovibrio ferrireducens TaxID=246191 RepID=A0A1G9GYA3_9BACT|nr:FeoA family protein [Maridesulfovibrio ferrireducens]SDL05651.1 Fe2+ transport system protein FeoA [Maridesulfovibrio ferrireducens]
MSTPLTEAPIETPLILKTITRENLKNRLERMGLRTGCELKIMSEDSILCPVRVKGPKGEVLLAAGMASKIIIHHDDGHKTPVFEMRKGEKGHIEGLTAASCLENSLKTLGLSEGDNIEFIRCLPSMDYHIVVDGKSTHITEGMAAKVWGVCGKEECQLATCGKREIFETKSILGSPRVAEKLSFFGIKPGINIRLENVEPAKDFRMSHNEHIIILSNEGLRLHLRSDQAEAILVETA